MTKTALRNKLNKLNKKDLIAIIIEDETIINELNRSR